MSLTAHVVGSPRDDYPCPIRPSSAPPRSAWQVAKVTAMCFDYQRELLISSGDDGWIHQWDVNNWAPNRKQKPFKSINFNAWVTPELEGLPIRVRAAPSQTRGWKGRAH